MRTVTIAELAEEAGAPLALVERLVAIGQVRPLPDGRFDPRDEAAELRAELGPLGDRSSAVFAA